MFHSFFNKKAPDSDPSSLPILEIGSIKTTDNQRPSLLVLQTESVLLEFEKNTALPLRLETNLVCTCVCLVIFSQQQGLAYLAHIDLSDSGPSKAAYWDYEKLIAAMVSEYGLNSSNSLVALIGSQDRTLEHLSVISNFLSNYFTSIIKDVGGCTGTERCIQLSNLGLEYVRIIYTYVGITQSSLSYKQHLFVWDHNDDALVNLYKIEWQINGRRIVYPLESSPVDLPLTVSDPKNWNSIQSALISTLPPRRRGITLGLSSKSPDLIFYENNARLSILKDAFNLTNVDEMVISKPLFECAIHRGSLFTSLKTTIGLESANKLSYVEINDFINHHFLSRDTMFHHDAEKQKAEIEGPFSQPSYKTVECCIS